ncbi:MBL fold metallo-hydrolase [Ruminococcus sp. RTP21484sp1]|jgi:hydroxyacylglutathione hydrolase|uniref:MBL fold metallo-hydrolase n=1 Tax=Ruminococcus sp. RTP21484sp1 TaxID=3151395 RepID=UPI00321AFB17
MELFRVKQINEYTWLIGENIRSDFTDTCVLLVGEQKAALIDTGCGLRKLKEIVKNLTKLPVMVLTTHVHLDHIGGHGLFRDCEIYASQKEMDAWKKSADRESFSRERLGFLHTAVEGQEKLYQEIEAQIVRECDFFWEPLKDGMIFDLGSRKLEACMIPGHTVESFAFVERESGNAFVGDSVNLTPWIFPEEGTSVEKYGLAVKRFWEIFPEVQHIYSGHCMRDIGVQTIADTLKCTEEILAGVDDLETECYVGKVYEHVTGIVTMFYRKQEENRCTGMN